MFKPILATNVKGLGKLERRKDFLKRAKVKKLQEQTTMYLKQKGSNKQG